MSEFYRPTQEEPDDKEAFEHELAEAPNQAEVDKLIRNKAHDILTEISAKEILSELSEERKEELESKIEEAINPQITVKFEFNSNDSYLAIDKLEHDLPDLEEAELLSIMLARIDEEISTVPNKLKAIEENAKFIKNSDDIKIALVNLQNELTMLRQQLEYKLNSQLELEGVSIQDALNQYRRFKFKLEKLPEDSLEREDIERVLKLYADYIKDQFEQSPEKYALGKSQALGIDIKEIVNEFIESNDLTSEQKFHQGDITEARQNITTELSQTPGIVGVIPMPGETQGSKVFDIIAITLKPDNLLPPDEVNKAMKLLYYQIQTFAKSQTYLIEDNKLDLNNIEIYTNGKILGEYEVDTQSDLDLSKIFQLHRIKIAKRSTDFKYKEEYTDHYMAMSRPAQSLDDNSSIPTLTYSYTTQEDTRLVSTPFNKAMFQLSVQQALGLPLA
jgi:hypothetical protein